MFTTEELPPFPPNSNPFHHDAYHMGDYIAKNVAIMFATHPSERATYIIIINRETGERLKVTLLDEATHGRNGVARTSAPTG